jgi:ankyrin repeat protein
MKKHKRLSTTRASGPELFESVMSGELSVVKQLVRRGINLDIRRDGFTPLMFAVANANEKMTAYLIEHGANVNLRNRIGQTPLMLAATKGHKPIVEELVNAGADTCAVDDEGRSAMAWAVSRGDFPEVISFLFTFGADPNTADRTGLTPLMRAAMLGFVDSVAVLLTIGADDTAKSHGKTAYQLALEKGNEDVCRTMKKVLKNVPKGRWY